MKVIDLLNKIANKEEMPQKIEYGGREYEWTGTNYYNAKNDEYIEKHICLEDLEYPVKIIEENNKIEKLVLDYAPDIEEKIFYDNGDKPNHCIVGDSRIELIIKKINEIIDVINEMKNED